MGRSPLPLSMHGQCTLSDPSAASCTGVTPPPPLPNVKRRQSRRRPGRPGPVKNQLPDLAACQPHLPSPSRSLLRFKLMSSFRRATRQRSRTSLPLWPLHRSGALLPHPPLLGPRSGERVLRGVALRRLTPSPSPVQTLIDYTFVGCNIARQVALPSTPLLS